MTAIKRCFILASILAVIIFASSMSNAQEVAYSFDKNDGNGSRPGGKLVRVNGYLYGLANDGGDFGKGVLFRVKPDGSDYEVIHHFQVATGSLAVSGGLVTHGEWLYGETTHGGLHDSGVLFKVRLDGSEYTVLHDFGLAGEPSGISSRPYLLGEYLFCLEGNIGAGQFFRVNVNTGVLTTLHNFNTGIDSSHHFNADLTYDGQRFYSTSERGGQFSAGTIFSILPDGSGYNQLYSFDPTKEDGCEPSGAALLLKGEHLYGITPVGIDSDWGRPKAVGGQQMELSSGLKKMVLIIKLCINS